MDGNRNYADEPEPRWYSEGRDYGEYGDAGRRPEAGYRAPEPRSAAGGVGYGGQSMGTRSSEPLSPLPGDDTNDPLTGTLPTSDPLIGTLPTDEPVQRYHAEPIDLGELRRGAAATVSQGAQPPLVPSPVSIPSAAAVPQATHLSPGVSAPSDFAHTPNPTHAPTTVHPTHTPDPMSVPGAAAAPGHVVPPRVVTSPNLSAPQAVPPAAGPVGAGPEPERGGLYHTRRAGLALMLAIATFFFELPVLWAFGDSAFADRVSVSGTVSSLLMMIGLPMFALGLYASFGGAAASPTHGPRAWARTPLAYLPIALVIFLAAALATR